MLLAKCRTRTRVSQMVVRYMSHKGKPGIAIATLRAIGDKPATKTEVCVIHISLEALEKLSANQDPGGPPFNLVELHKTRCQVAFLNLEGVLLSVIHRPRTLMFLDLETKQSSQLKLPHSNEGQVSLDPILSGILFCSRCYAATFDPSKQNSSTPESGAGGSFNIH